MDQQISTDQIKEINKRYSNRLNLYGKDPRSLGWSSKLQQNIRFDRFSKHILNIDQASIVDIGCGFGDFGAYLRNKKENPKSYVGVDINENLLAVAKEEAYAFPAEFLCGNILDDYFRFRLSKYSCDIVMSMGLFNLDFHGSRKKMLYFMKLMIKKMVTIASSKVIIDFIPEQRQDNYQAESYIATYCLDTVKQFMEDCDYRYQIEISEVPNPMTEALLIIDIK